VQVKHPAAKQVKEQGTEPTKQCGAIEDGGDTFDYQKME